MRDNKTKHSGGVSHNACSSFIYIFQKYLQNKTSTGDQTPKYKKVQSSKRQSIYTDWQT